MLFSLDKLNSMYRPGLGWLNSGKLHLRSFILFYNNNKKTSIEQLVYILYVSEFIK